MILAIRNRRILTAWFIAVALMASAAVFLRLQGRALLENLQYYVQDQLGQSLNAEVTIASIKPSITGATVLKGLSLTKHTTQDTSFVFKGDKVIIYTNIMQLAMEKFLKKNGGPKKNVVFKIENGFLYKGQTAILKNISGYGKIENNIFTFDDINGKCYNFPLSVYGKVSGDTSKIDLNIKSASDIFRGKVHLSSSVLRPHAVGTVEFKGGHKMCFSGDFDIKPGESVAVENLMFQNSILASAKLDISKRRFYAEVKKRLEKSGSISQKDAKGATWLTMDFSKPGILQGSIFFNHVGIGGFDFQSQLDLELAFCVNASGNSINGKIKTSGTILDYRPFKELNGEFCVENNVLKFSSLKWGEAYTLYGYVHLYAPYETDLMLDVKDGSLSQLLLVSDVESEDKVSGAVNGHIKTSGPIDSLTTVAKLECGKGRLGNLDYESMNINLHGTGPVLKVADSRILRKEGYIDLSGEVDLKRLWSQEPCKGLAWACGNEAVVWDGWDIVKQTDSQLLEMKKGVGREKEFMITFKSYLNNEQSWQDSQGGNQNEAVGVEYSLDDAKSVKMQIKGNEEVFSLENKVKF